MRPYPGILENEQRVYKFCLSRARRCIEKSFGIMVQRYGVLKSDLKFGKNAKNMATAGCVLHNILRLWSELGEAVSPVPPNGALLEGVDEVEDKELVVDMVGPAFERREKLKNFFNGVGAIPAQGGCVCVIHPI